MGSDSDGRRWFGLNGALKLIEGIPAGASAEGLKFYWRDGPDGKPIPDGVSFEGIGVNFEVPGVFAFKGHVAYKQTEDGDVFTGGIALELTALGTTVDGQVVFGTNKKDGTRYMAVYLGADLPSAIPLFATGLGVYGIAGLACVNMEPKKDAGVPWYAAVGPDWYHAVNPPGMLPLDKQWRPKAGALAFGAGVTLGTLNDNGRTFHGKFLLAVLLPGPVIMIQGQANLMQERHDPKDKEKKDTKEKEPQFQAFAALDVPAGTLTFGLDAKYAYPDGGGLLAVSGSVETYFNLSNPSDWYLHVGKDKPMTARIQAQILSLFSAKAYLMLSSSGIKTGAWAGLDKQWKFGPAEVKLAAWVDGNVAISLMPPQFHGDLTLQASAGVKVFGVGVGLSIHSHLSVDVFDPFEIEGSLKVAVDLFWPLDDWETSIHLKWTKPNAPAKPKPAASPSGGPPLEAGDWPPIALPLKDVAVGHAFSETRWPLPRPAEGKVDPFNPANELLYPNYALKDGYVRNDSKVAGLGPAVVQGNLVPSPEMPVVPLDGRLELTFARPMGDVAKVGGPAVKTVAVDVIGNPADSSGPKPSGGKPSPLEVDYTLQDLKLAAWDGNEWKQLDIPLTGQWLGAQDGQAQTKLWVTPGTTMTFEEPVLDFKLQPGAPAQADGEGGNQPDLMIHTKGLPWFMVPYPGTSGKTSGSPVFVGSEGLGDDEEDEEDGGDGADNETFDPTKRDGGGPPPRKHGGAPRLRARYPAQPEPGDEDRDEGEGDRGDREKRPVQGSGGKSYLQISAGPASSKGPETGPPRPAVARLHLGDLDILWENHPDATTSVVRPHDLTAEERRKLAPYPILAGLVFGSVPPGEQPWRVVIRLPEGEYGGVELLLTKHADVYLADGEGQVLRQIPWHGDRVRLRLVEPDLAMVVLVSRAGFKFFGGRVLAP